MKLLTLVSLVALSINVNAQSSSVTIPAGPETLTLDQAPKGKVQAPDFQGASTTAVTDAAITKYPFSVSLINDSIVASEAARYINNAMIYSENYLSANYSLTSKTTIGLRQYADYITLPNSTNDNHNELLPTFTAMTLKTTFGSVLGSKPFAPVFVAFLPTTAATAVYERAYDAQSIKLDGILRMDGELGWEISPLFTAAYYLSARDYLFRDQVYVKKTIPAGQITNPTAEIENILRVVHSANLYMTLNDHVMPYTYWGLDQRFLPLTGFQSSTDEFIGGLGALFTFGHLTVAPEANTRTALKLNGQAQGPRPLLQPSEISYEVVTTLTF